MVKMGEREVTVMDNGNYPDICWKPYVAES